MKKSIAAAFLCLLFLFSVAYSEPSPTLIVFPFETFAKPGPPVSGKVIQKLLIQQLLQQGFEVPSLEACGEELSEPVRSDARARFLARRLKADYALFGSITQVGDTFKLDVRVVDVKNKQNPICISSMKRGMENLALAAREISQQLAVRLLNKAIIADVKVKGNERIETDAILIDLKSQKGTLLDPQTVREDIKTIYRMGYFESVQADVKDSAEGKILTFIVREKPTVAEVRIRGNKKVAEKDILDAISTKPFTILQRNVVNEDVQKIKRLYQGKAFFDAEVKASIDFPKDPRKAVVTFNIKENKRVYIKRIDFIGNKHFSDRKLRKVMETKPRNIFLWFTNRGILQKEVLKTDLDRLAAFYYDRGYLDAKIGSPRIERRKKGFYITIPVVEGQRYRVKSVQIAGDLLDINDKLKADLRIRAGDYFSRENLRIDLDNLTRAYMNEGYAYAEIEPEIRRYPKAGQVAIVYKAHKGPKVHIESISIVGNTKTRDKVIRRELRLAPGDQFSAKKLERSSMNLQRLDFFEKVDITPARGTRPDTMNLHIKVKEKSTGMLSVGGGYSSDEGPFASGSVTQKNLFGRGQYLSLRAYISEKDIKYTLSFTEPWLFDRPTSAGFDAYNWRIDYTDFTKDSIGGKVRLGHLFGNWSRWQLSFLCEDANVTDVADDAATIIREQEGHQLKTSVTGALERDTTDHPFLPTRGSISSISVEFSSPVMGSDSDFVKYVVNSGKYFPLLWKFVGFVRGKAGWIVELDRNRPVPIYDRFFLGGLNTLRAFNWGDVGPKDPETGDVIGGLSFGLVNLELLFPISKKWAMRGVFFFDAGNAFEDTDDFNISKFRTDAGAGIRWASPLGPIRIEYAVNLDRKPGESPSKWQFSTGMLF